MDILRAVFDTNVFVSGTTIHQISPPRQVLDAWRQNQIEIAISEPLLSELARTLDKPKVQKRTGFFTPEERQSYIESIRSGAAIVVSGITPVNVSLDPDDNALFACAIEAQADYIVSGDMKHVLVIPEFQGIRTISPRDFVEEVIPKAA